MNQLSYRLPKIVQRFHRGDIVKVKNPLPQRMNHFRGAGKAAVIEGSYADLCSQHMQKHGREEIGSDLYSLFFPETGYTCAWYDADLLTLVKERVIDEVYGRDQPSRDREITPRALKVE